jgi:hypothetical protein
MTRRLRIERRGERETVQQYLLTAGRRAPLWPTLEGTVALLLL